MYKEREVRAGIALLDEKDPGWRDKFNPSTLRMAGSSTCVLGQTFGSYGLGIDVLKLRHDMINASQTEEYGFYIPVSEAAPLGSVARDINYMQLGETWKALVPQTAAAIPQPLRIAEVIEPVISVPERELVLV